MDTRKANDLLRTKEIGGCYMFGSEAFALFDADEQEALILMVVEYDDFHDERHSWGLFTFKGHVIHWRIENIYGHWVLTISLQSEVLKAATSIFYEYPDDMVESQEKF